MTEDLNSLAPRVVVHGLAATECPRWHDGHLYFSDMHGKAVYVLAEDGPWKLADIPGTPTGLGWLPDGSMPIVSQNEQAVLVAEGGAILSVVPTRDKCLSVALGGSNNDELYLCTTPGPDPRRSVDLAGSRVEVAKAAVGRPA